VLEIGLLGPLLMNVDGRPVRLGSPKQRAVLAMLAINRNRAVAVDTLISALWGERPPADVRANIHTYVSNLRKLISDGGLAGKAVLAAAPPGYRLSLPDSGCDLPRFLAAKNEGVRAAAAGRFDDAGRHLSTALHEWRGPVLDDLRDFPFTETCATSIAEEKLLAQTARAESEIACGRPYAVIAELEALAAQHPYREPLWAQLITAYYLDDRQADALGAYRRLKDALVDDLGIDPTPALSALHQRILRQEALDVRTTASTAATATVSVLNKRTGSAGHHGSAYLRDASNCSYPIRVATPRIG